MGKKKLNYKFFIPAALILLVIFNESISNVKYLMDYSRKISESEGYNETLVALVKGEYVFSILLAVMAVTFFVGCIQKAFGTEQSLYVKIYSVRGILMGIGCSVISLCSAITSLGEVIIDAPRVIIPTLTISLVIFLPITIFSILLLLSEIKKSNGLRIATSVLMILNICVEVLFVVIIIAADIYDDITGYIWNCIYIILSGVAIISYQLMSLEKKQPAPKAPQPIGYVPVQAPYQPVVNFGAPQSMPVQNQIPYQPMVNYGAPVQKPAPDYTVRQMPVQNPVPQQAPYTPHPAYTPVQNGISQNTSVRYAEEETEREKAIRKAKVEAEVEILYVNEKMKMYNELLENGTLTQEEYDKKREELIKSL